MTNSMNVPSKRSALERKRDKLILVLFCTLFAMCLIGAIGSGVFINRKYYYLGFEGGDMESQFNPNSRFLDLASKNTIMVSQDESFRAGQTKCQMREKVGQMVGGMREKAEQAKDKDDDTARADAVKNTLGMGGGGNSQDDE